MTDLRTAAQQALEALEQSETFVPYEGFGMARREAERKHQAAITALRAALAEPVLNPAPGYCKHCKQYTIEEPLPAEPVQEPVAWIHTDPDKRRVKFLEWRENEPGYRGDWIKTPLYAAPLQRLPLSEEDINRIDNSTHFHEASDWSLRFARAIERAHEIV